MYKKVCKQAMIKSNTCLFIVVSKAKETISRKERVRTRKRSTIWEHEEMIKMHQRGVSQKEIAERFGVSISSVSRHINGLSKPLKPINVGSKEMVVKKELIGNLKKIKQKFLENKPPVKEGTRKVKVVDGFWVHAPINEPVDSVVARWKAKLKSSKIK